MSDSSELSQLFAAERAVRSEAGAVERGVSRLLTDLAASAAPAPAAVGAAKLGWPLLAKWIGGGFLLGVLGSGAATQLSAPPAPTSAVSATARPARAIGTLPAPSAISSAALVAPSVSVAPMRSNRSAAHAPPSPNGSSVQGPSTFDAELILITRAKGELDRGRAHLASVWLNEHAARFPGGVFATDREGLRVLVSCATSRNEAAFAAFARRYPSSPMLEKLRRACSEPTPEIDK
jgi:hypothetical protein